MANLQVLMRIKAERHTNPQLESWKPLTDEQMNQLIELLRYGRRISVPQFFVSCWHMNEHESAAMWRLYTQSHESICVQSTFTRLAAVLPSYGNVGVIRYLDYETETVAEDNLFNFIMCKRRSFEHEREVRAVIWEQLGGPAGGDEIRSRCTPFGLPVPVDLVQLIEAILVSPTSPAWFVDVVKELLESQKLQLPVIQSSLSTPPIF
jgi:hypothetical protein